MKVSSVGVEVDVYAGLVRSGSRLIDPFEMNRLQDNTTAISLALPSTNLRYGDDPTVVDGFRRRVDEIFRGEATQTGTRGERLIDTLYDLAVRSDRNGTVSGDGVPAVVVRTCPCCRFKPEGGFVIPSGTPSVV